MGGGCSVFHERKDFYFGQWQIHLIDLNAKMVCIHEECKSDNFLLNLHIQIFLYGKRQRTNNIKKQYVNVHLCEVELSRLANF